MILKISKPLRFPNPDYVYLVNNRPVITSGISEKIPKRMGILSSV